MMQFLPVLNRNKIHFNNKLLPNNFRCLIIGTSGCGKNVLLQQMLLIDNFLDFDNLIFFSTTIKQDEVQLIKEGFENGLTKKGIRNIFENQNNFPQDVDTPSKMIKYFVKNITQIPNSKEYYNDDEKISILFSNKSEDILPCDDLPKDKKNLIIFDDVVNLRNQSIMKSYFCRGRHNNCNTIYISQNYYGLDKDSIRNNCNCFIFFKLPKRDKDLIYHDLFSNILTDKGYFDQMISQHWSEKYNYIYLDRENEEINKNLFLFLKNGES